MLEVFTSVAAVLCFVLFTVRWSHCTNVFLGHSMEKLSRRVLRIERVMNGKRCCRGR